jgi:glycosyltransferase involved in cell wall biosynthesis
LNLPAAVVHITHTDIRADARILRQLHVLGAQPWLDVIGIGLESNEGIAAAQRRAFSTNIHSIRLVTRQFVFIPRAIRYLLNLCELALRMLPAVLAHRPKVVHCHDTMVLPIGVVARLLTGCLVFYDAHELESNKSGQTRLLSRGTLLIERWCWRQVSLLVSVSQSILDWYRDNLGERRSVLVLNSPLASASPNAEVHGDGRTFGSPGYFHGRFVIPAGTPVFIYLGYLVSGRGIESTLQAFGSGNMKSHVVFMGSDDTLGVQDHAKRFPNIHFHPVVPHEEVVRYVREADCGLCLIEDVSLSDRLCLPNKLFEYAFAGIPVLASRLPEIARVVNEYRLGACCDNDADSIEAAVLKIEREGLARPEADLTELSWDTQAKRLQEAYRQLLLDGGAAVPDKQGDR